jgi:hypothetical protein
MSIEAKLTAARTYGIDGGETFFDTDAWPVQFVPAAEEINLTSKVITWPDLVKTNAYAYARGLIGSTLYSGCNSYITVPFQEWGPADMLPPPTNELADEVIGTAPAGSDHLIVLVKLTRTTSPSQMAGKTIPVLFAEDKWVNCPGGGLPIEKYGPFARHLAIVLADTPNVDGSINIILRRKQSIYKRRYSFWRSDNSPEQSGWTWGGTNGIYGHIVAQVQSLGPTIDPSTSIRKRNGSGPCSLTDPTDYTSVYTGDIRIIAGRDDIEPANERTGPLLAFCGTEATDSASSTHTFDDVSIGAESATRRVFVAISAIKRIAAGTGYFLNSVTVNGASAANMVERRSTFETAGDNDSVFIASIYAIDVPTGTTADIVVNYSASFNKTRIAVFSAYDLVSGTPDGTISSATANSATNLTTVADGIAIACSVYSDVNPDFTGIANSFLDALPGTPVYPISSAYQYTDGSTLSIKCGLTAGSQTKAWVAASFH